MRMHGCAARWRLAVGLLVLPLVGCASANPFTLRKENMALKQSLSQLQTQNAQAQNRNKVLDADNKQLASRLAQEQQQGEQLRGELSQSRSQSEASARVASGPVRTEVGASRSASLSSRRRGSADGWLPLVDISGAEVQREGEQVRIRITNAQLFDAGSAKLKPGASRVLDRVARAVRESYPGMMIGVQGHTDGDPIKRSKWKDNHELSVQRALAVYEYLKSKGTLPSDRLYVAGYGPNVPVASNSSSGGKAQNRRVDIVVSPSEHSVAWGENYRD